MGTLRRIIFSDYASPRTFPSIQVLREGDKCRLFYATGSSRPCEAENDYRSSEDGLRELAVGIKGSIDVETYVRSLQGKLIKVSTKAPRQSSRLAELLRQRRSMKAEYEWYKQCMRKRIILPYFENIADSYLNEKPCRRNSIEEKSLACYRGKRTSIDIKKVVDSSVEMYNMA